MGQEVRDLKKRLIPAEWAFLGGTVLLAFGVALMAKADLGIGMVVAPAYLVHLKWPQISFGQGEYILQGILLVLVGLGMGRFRWSYLFSFVAALLYGFVLDLFVPFMELAPSTLPFRMGFYLLGLLICALGIALFFRTYLPPQVYELFVKELSGRFRIPMHRFKQGYDIGSLLVALVLTLVFFGEIRALGIGTVIAALLNGPLIGFMGRFLDRRLVFRGALGLEGYFRDH